MKKEKELEQWGMNSKEEKEKKKRRMVRNGERKISFGRKNKSKGTVWIILCMCCFCVSLVNDGISHFHSSRF